jgi:hypothetical protein
LDSFAGWCCEIGEGKVFAQIALRFQESVVNVLGLFGRELCIICSRSVKVVGRKCLSELTLPPGFEDLVVPGRLLAILRQEGASMEGPEKPLS